MRLWYVAACFALSVVLLVGCGDGDASSETDIEDAVAEVEEVVVHDTSADLSADLPPSCPTALVVTNAGDMNVFETLGCTELDSLEIRGTELTSFAALGALEAVHGDVLIKENPQLDDLGLTSLREVGGTLTIQALDTSLNLDSLISLRSVGGLDISGAAADLTVLVELTEVVASVSVSLNSATGKSGLDSIATIGGDLYLSFGWDDSLPTMRGLTRVDGDVTLQYNVNAERVDGFDSLLVIGGSLSLTDNTLLQAIRGMTVLDEVGGDIVMKNCPCLGENVALPFIDGITTVGGTVTLDLPESRFGSPDCPL